MVNRSCLERMTCQVGHTRLRLSSATRFRTTIEKGIIDSALNSYYGYIYTKKRNLRGEELMSDEIELR